MRTLEKTFYKNLFIKIVNTYKKENEMVPFFKAMKMSFENFLIVIEKLISELPISLSIMHEDKTILDLLIKDTNIILAELKEFNNPLGKKDEDEFYENSFKSLFETYSSFVFKYFMKLSYHRNDYMNNLIGTLKYMNDSMVSYFQKPVALCYKKINENDFPIQEGEKNESTSSND